MTDNVSRLGEAQKQIRRAAGDLDDPELVEDLKHIDAIIEAIKEDLTEP